VPATIKAVAARAVFIPVMRRSAQISRDIAQRRFVRGSVKGKKKRANSESENLFDSFHRNALMGFYRHA
jgi:hypothetical protein